MRRLLATEFSKRNLDFNISNDELVKYVQENKAEFEAYPVISGDTENKATEERSSRQVFSGPSRGSRGEGT
jgi:hypothetical protein